MFLALTFLLGVFPLKDADYYWHLRTGDLIRETGQIPRVDFYTFTRAGTPWIDLHWIFQVGISWIREWGGVPALTLAKCAITCLAVFLLITARRRSWPVWAILLAWIPALFVLSGRMYIRPETLSLLYLAVYLAVICRWHRRPWLAWTLPVVQVAWVNSHGLFVLGPVVLAFGLIDAVLRRGAFGPDRVRWWQKVAPAVAAVGLACLINPYGFRGAIYPLELAGTMGNPIFSRGIAELTPIPLFIQRSGLSSLPLQLHLATMALGALSFLIPLCWTAFVAVRDRQRPEPETNSKTGDRKNAKKAPSKPRKKRGAANDLEAEPPWRISIFRLLLYAAFSVLSLQATRNSHQFAAVVGTVTAWNFAEFVAARRRYLDERMKKTKKDDPEAVAMGLRPRLLTMVVLTLALIWVGSGQFYVMAAEGRTIGWDEEPLWFPHEAVQFTGKPGMPDRFLSFHNAHASLFEYYHSPRAPGEPGRTVFTDPRLEVAGVDLFDQYQKLGSRIGGDQTGWEAQLDQIGRPTILVDHMDDNSRIGAALLGSQHWRCVWFDPIVAVFVHDSYGGIVKAHEVDFGARHFRPDPATEPHGQAALLATAKGVRNYLNFSMNRPDLARQLVWLGLDYARRIIDADHDSLDGWKSLAQLELLRDSAGPPSARFQAAFDPVLDLGAVRATYAFRRALELAPNDFLSLLGMQQALELRKMSEAQIPLLTRVLGLTPINAYQRAYQAQAATLLARHRESLGPEPSTSWKNLDKLDQIVKEQLARGRVETVAEILERAYPDDRAPWAVVDRIATLRLHLGQPALAREHWQKAATVPQPAVRDARIAATHLAENQIDAAATAYEKALATDPNLFEAAYGLAVLEQDRGRAAPAYQHALTALELAPNDLSRSAARALASAVGRFAREPRTTEKRP
jgi:tetratricopeptide (TPR) repeat protein